VFVSAGDAASPQEVHAENHGLMPLSEHARLCWVNGWRRHLATCEALLVCFVGVFHSFAIIVVVLRSGVAAALSWALGCS
jgi:hypothetical protein